MSCKQNESIQSKMPAVSSILDHWHFKLKNMMNLVDCLYHDLRHSHPYSDHCPGWLHTLSETKQYTK